MVHIKEDYLSNNTAALDDDQGKFQIFPPKIIRILISRKNFFQDMPLLHYFSKPMIRKRKVEL